MANGCRISVLPAENAHSIAFVACPPRANRYILHGGKTAALDGSILVVFNLRRDLSGVAIIEQLASDDLPDCAYDFCFFSTGSMHSVKCPAPDCHVESSIFS